MLLLSTRSGSEAMQAAVWISVTPITTTASCGCPWSGLPPGIMLMSKGCAKLALALTGCSPPENWPRTMNVWVTQQILVSGVQVSRPRGCERGRAGLTTHHSLLSPRQLWQVGELALSHTGCSTQESWPCTSLGQHRACPGGMDADGGLTNSASTQTQIRGCEWVHPSIYPIYKLLQPGKEPVLSIQSCRISTTQGKQDI